MKNMYVGPANDPDRYRLAELRSSGGEGQLWKGSVTVDGVDLPVAVKVVHGDHLGKLDEWRERWRRQAEVLRSLEHPSLVKVREVFDGPLPHIVGEADSSTRTLYLIMNWVPGQTLEAWASSQPDRDILESLRVIARVSAAVDYMHSGTATERAVLHRDIKPSNVLIEADSVRLVDFGFVRMLDSEAMTFAGTPLYMAPEVVSGGPHSTAADRFSLGATAYFAITGELPSPNGRTAMRDRLVAVRGGVGREDLAQSVLAMMDPDPDRRPTSSVSWAQGLAAIAVSDATSPALVAPTLYSAHPPVIAEANRGRSRFRVALAVILATIVGAGMAFALSGGDEPESDDQAAVSSEEESTTTSLTATSSTARSSTTTSVLEPVAMPDVIGSTLSEATSTFRKLGVTITTVDVTDLSQPDGTVVGQDPPEGTRITEAVTLEVASQPSSVFLTDLEPVEGDGLSSGLFTISGEPYVDSVLLSLTPYDLGDEGFAGYDLGRRYSRFLATAGLGDKASSTVMVKFEVFADGESVFSQTLGLGEPAAIDVDVTGVLRLRLVAIVVAEASCTSCAPAIFGDARLVTAGEG